MRKNIILSSVCWTTKFSSSSSNCLFSLLIVSASKVLHSSNDFRNFLSTVSAPFFCGTFLRYSLNPPFWAASLLSTFHKKSHSFSSLGASSSEITSSVDPNPQSAGSSPWAVTYFFESALLGLIILTFKILLLTVSHDVITTLYMIP